MIQMLRAFCAVVAIFGCVSGVKANPFRIQNISVEVKSSSIAEAKEKAFIEGRSKAFHQIVSKMVDPKQADALDAVEDSSITYLIDSMQVMKETIGSKAYKAVIAFEFNKERVEGFLRKHSVEFVSPNNKAVVLVPVLSDGAKTYLFEKNNEWFNLWQTHPLNQALCTLIIPNGDLGDIHTLNAEDAIVGAPTNLQNLAVRYDADAVIVVHVSISRQQDSWKANVEFQEYDAKGVKKSNIMKGHELSYTISEKSKEDILSELLTIAMQQIRLGLRADFGASQQQGAKHFYLKFKSPTKEDYAKYLRLIEHSSLISQVTPVQLSRNYSFVRIETTYHPQDLIKYLASHGYYFEISESPLSKDVHLKFRKDTF